MDQLPEVPNATSGEIENEPGFRPVVLAVEDQDSARSTLARVLTIITCGMSERSDVAANGEEALNKWREDGIYNILLTDFNMPKMNGIILAKEIKAISPNAVVILMTTEPNLGEQELGNGGIDYFLRKPFTSQELSGLLQEIIKRQNEALVRGNLLSNDQSKD